MGIFTDDIKAFDEALAQNEELLPADLVDRILAGDNKIKVWREYRGLSQAELAQKMPFASRRLRNWKAASESIN